MAEALGDDNHLWVPQSSVEKSHLTTRNSRTDYYMTEKQTIVLSHGNVEATFVIAASVTLTDINMLYNNYYNNNGKSVRHCIK